MKILTTMQHILIDFISLFFAGLLAGEELVICYGVRAPLSKLDGAPQIRFRQALILRLRVLVPVILGMTTLSSVTATILQGRGTGFGARCAGLGALLAFMLVTFLGTVPINQGALTWLPGAPPSDWRALVSRWERLDVARCWTALATFVLFLTAVALQR